MKLHPLMSEQPWVPQRLIQSHPRQFLSWTYRQRTVFALVDGTRNTVQIAQLLSISSMKVLKTLHELQDMYVIVKGNEMYGRETKHG